MPLPNEKGERARGDADSARPRTKAVALRVLVLSGGAGPAGSWRALFRAYSQTLLKSQ